MLRPAIPCAAVLLLCSSLPAIASPDRAARLVAARVATAAAPPLAVREVAIVRDGARSTVRIGVESGGRRREDIPDAELRLGEIAGRIAETLPKRFRGADLVFEIDGTPLPEWLGEQTRGAAALSAEPLPPAATASLGVAGRRIAVSAGHGWYHNGSAWTLQRSYFYGIVEDFVNAELAMLVQSRLLASGALVTPLRQMSKSAGNGISGKPKWQEAARYHLRAIGAPSSIWNEPGYSTLSQDIRCRPRYANSVGADLLVSIHNNGGLGTGTEVWFDNANGWQAPSRRLADAIRTSVVSAIRQAKYPAWTDRGTKSCNGCKGENRLATRPAVIVELAFMDRRTPDNAALQDPTFRAIVAEAIARGVRSYYAAQ